MHFFHCCMTGETLFGGKLQVSVCLQVCVYSNCSLSLWEGVMKNGAIERKNVLQQFILSQNVIK